ncbi:hypothetical protein PTNB85_04267 [Pyrenophora teres f. teres]|uniref:Uncharacterized protein n=1 Tax=Pyrenophora teres f. teres TaxID=97479 RepID=A0A6Y9WJA3_9PLEO|nr:hypothetical protein HRS9139_05183 [Pyrenophora teres f. teres]KAE8840868.1 hypothetical protein PTNB85_04267 [Pyrenophora teres f. teres]KAE8864364.1 hypothetical protein PTNB29_04328 [Pyrenophora teres f. teres]CAE7031393.1 hypothetical protein PTTW11_04792 [Pyrenophora teres f. teres]
MILNVATVSRSTTFPTTVVSTARSGNAGKPREPKHGVQDGFDDEEGKDKCDLNSSDFKNDENKRKNNDEHEDDDDFSWDELEREWEELADRFNVEVVPEGRGGIDNLQELMSQMCIGLPKEDETSTAVGKLLRFVILVMERSK